MKIRELRMLVIGAHPDDCEFLTGGTAAKYRKLGHVVKYISMTNGDAGHYSMTGKELAARRLKEFQNSCSITGIECEVMDIHDGKLETTLENRENLIRLIRNFKPDLIFTHRLNDYHPDHRNTAQLVQDSSFAVMVPNLCPDTPSLDYAPVILYLHDNFKTPYKFKAHIVIGIDDVFDTKVQMLHCHKSQIYEWLPWLDKALDSVPENDSERLKWFYNFQVGRDGFIAQSYGEELKKRYGEAALKIKYAEAFEISEYGGELNEELLKLYFPF